MAEAFPVSRKQRLDANVRVWSTYVSLIMLAIVFVISIYLAITAEKLRIGSVLFAMGCIGAALYVYFFQMEDAKIVRKRVRTGDTTGLILNAVSK